MNDNEKAAALRAVADAIKHLVGQHDQASHGKRGGGGSSLPSGGSGGGTSKTVTEGWTETATGESIKKVKDKESRIKPPTSKKGNGWKLILKQAGKTYVPKGASGNDGSSYHKSKAIAKAVADAFFQGTGNFVIAQTRQ